MILIRLIGIEDDSGDRLKHTIQGMTQREKSPLFNYMIKLNVRRIRENSELSKLRGRGGYVLNTGRSKAMIHRIECITVGWMNLGKRGGVYHADMLEAAMGWLDAEGIIGVPCRLCLPALTYRPRPESLMERVRRVKT